MHSVDVGRVMIAALRTDCTVHQATANAAATSSTARPEPITARSTAAFRRVRHLARASSWSVAWVKVRRPQACSAQTFGEHLFQ